MLEKLGNDYFRFVGINMWFISIITQLEERLDSSLTQTAH